MNKKALLYALKSHLRPEVKLYDVIESPQINETYLKVDVWLGFYVVIQQLEGSNAHPNYPSLNIDWIFWKML